MKVLTDTHTLVWALERPEYLSTAARDALAKSEVITSVANYWELCLKFGKKDALVSDPVIWWARYVAGTGLATIPIRTAHVTALSSLPEIHKDPFDRILVAQSIAEAAALVTKDSDLSRYGIPTIW